jgi:hypothetical protein
LYSGLVIRKASWLEQRFRRSALSGRPSRFEVTVVERQRVVGEIDQGDFAACGAGRSHRGPDQLAVPGIAANAAGEGENLGHGVSLHLK